MNSESGNLKSIGDALPKVKGGNNHSTYCDMLLKMRKEFYQRFERKIKCCKDGINNYQMFSILGEGSFGRVMLARKQESGGFCAIKTFDKSRVVKLKQVEHTLYEKKVLESVRFPFIISLDTCFKDNTYLYFIMPFVNGGDMFFHLRRMSRFDENLSKFYAAQVLLALEYLHFSDILYRDLKPENILLDIKGYVKLGDLGFCKVVKGRTWTLCGTPEYIAPEIILSKGYGKAVDWWSFGVLVYEMNAGYSPFASREPMVIYEKIVSGKYKTPSHFSFPLMDFIKNLLQLDLSRRYGNLKNGTLDLKDHRWLNDIDWLDIYYRKVDPPFIPLVKRDDDTNNFDVIKFDNLKVTDNEMFKKEFEQF